MKQEGKPVMRVIELTETDWKWLCGWVGQLLKVISIEEMTSDTLRMGAILTQVKEAKRKGENESGPGKL
jgi:hypothetical protein